MNRILYFCLVLFVFSCKSGHDSLKHHDSPTTSASSSKIKLASKELAKLWKILDDNKSHMFHKNRAKNKDIKFKSYKTSFNRYKEFVKSSSYSGYRFKAMSDTDRFKIDHSHKKPSYFSNPFNKGGSKPQVESREGYFDYAIQDTTQQKVYHVDFANERLGGGFLGRGFVQEETMFVEFLELDYHAIKDGLTNLGRSTLQTRVSNNIPGIQSNWALGGRPTPLIFEEVTRTGKFKYGKYKLTTGKSSYGAIKFETKDPLQKANILAIAAPKLKKGDTKSQTSFATLTDLFNTANAGFTFAKEQTDNKKLVMVTGALGAGVFYNHRIVVNVIQQLAAMHANVDHIIFYGYGTSEQIKANTLVNKILQQAQDGDSVASFLVKTKKILRTSL